MTRAELRAGLSRLTLLVAGLVMVALALGLVLYAVDGARPRDHIGEGFALVALGVWLVGIGSWWRSGPVARTGGAVAIRGASDRRQSEVAFAGAAALGTGFFAIALAIG